MREKLADALDHIRDSFISEAAVAKKRKHRPYWLGAVAAALALVIFFQNGRISLAVSAKAVSIASGSRASQRPDSDDYDDLEEWRADMEAWSAERSTREAAVDQVLQTCRFLSDSSAVFLSNSGTENRVWSPVNGYIALAMLAETTGGNTRRQILNVLNTDSVETLRAQVSAVWEEVYRDNSKEISVLANSLWLDESLSYDQQTMDALAYYHYASVYQGTLGSSKANKAMQTWLNNNTAGLLQDSANTVSLPAETMLALASTIYFQAKWSDQFHAANNTQDIFHSPSGDVTCTYMNKKELETNYYWGDSFGAVALGLKNGSRMWLILPDEGKTVNDVLSEGQYMELAAGTHGGPDGCSKYMKVNLSLPKFDAGSTADLKTGFQSLGITDVFDKESADFTPSVESETPVFVTSVNQAARVIIDEEGVKAASYIEIPGVGAAEPPEEIIDFILDRPFLFVIANSSGIPLFAGVVNNP